MFTQNLPNFFPCITALKTNYDHNLVCLNYLKNLLWLTINSNVYKHDNMIINQKQEVFPHAINVSLHVQRYNNCIY